MDIRDVQVVPEGTSKFSLRRVVKGLRHLGGLLRIGGLIEDLAYSGGLLRRVPSKFFKFFKSRLKMSKISSWSEK